MRFEVKFAYPPHLEDRVTSWLRLHPLAFRAAWPARRVNSVYFDTIDLQAFGENLAGVSERCKVRYRWYGDDPLPAAGQLELKHKRTTLGWKEATALAEAPCEPGDSWRAVHRRIRAHLDPGARLVFDAHPTAALLNRYTRRYFESHDGALRVTLDTAQEMFDQTQARAPNVRRRITLPAVHVLELKCDWRDRRAAVRALRDCPVRGSRFSKYTVGVELR